MMLYSVCSSIFEVFSGVHGVVLKMCYKPRWMNKTGLYTSLDNEGQEFFFSTYIEMFIYLVKNIVVKKNIWNKFWLKNDIVIIKIQFTDQEASISSNSLITIIYIFSHFHWGLVYGSHRPKPIFVVVVKFSMFTLF